MRKQASNSITRWFSQYGLRHIQAGFNGLGQLRRTPFNTVMTCLVIGIALALPMTLLVLLKNVNTLGNGFQQTTQLSVYLRPDASETDADNALQAIKNNRQIHAANLISPTEGLRELQKETGIGNVLEGLQENPLPWAITALPVTSLHSADALAELQHQIMQIANVDSVQIDTAWVERLFAIIALTHRIVYALAAFLSLAVLLIVNNCIRTATQNNRKEIDITLLLGGTHAFIRRPFLYAGMIYGLLGGILAWQLVDLFLLWIKAPTENLAALYHSQFQLLGLNMNDTLTLLIGSMALGFVGAWLAVTRHLYHPQI